MISKRAFWIVALLIFNIQGVEAQNTTVDLHQKAQALRMIREESKKQVKRIANYDALSKVEKGRYQKRIEYWLTRIYKLAEKNGKQKLPAHLFHINPALVYVADKKNEVNLIKHWNVAYVPNISLFYLIHLKYYEAYLKHGEDAPLPKIVMGIMHVESHYRWVKGDNLQSIGPCQLYKSTARWLLQHPDFGRIFRQFVYFDKHNEQGEHHFYTQEAMVEFMYEFLVHIKDYGKGNELQAIANYNGSSIWDPYSRRVKYAIAAYAGFLRQYNKGHKHPEELGARKVQDLRKRYYRRIFPTDNKGRPYLALHYLRSGYPLHTAEEQQPSEKAKPEVNVRIASGPEEVQDNHYLEKAANRSLFSYFRGNLVKAAHYHNRMVTRLTGKSMDFNAPLDDDFIYLYYLTGDKGQRERHFIRSKSAYSKAAAHYKIQTNFGEGRIYLKPDMPVAANDKRIKAGLKLEALKER